MLMHLAAASMGAGTQWVTIHIEEGFKKVLDVPDVINLNLIIPVGYPDVSAKEGVNLSADRYRPPKPLRSVEAHVEPPDHRIHLRPAW